jgi:diaminohydroxyphosphoribosylaminopyrimidine deaminase/5-amino-6-(5-phosphoribosylamino)uracil reductase
MQTHEAMRAALDAAWQYQGLTYPNPAVGASVVDTNGALLGVGAHTHAGGPHAEVLALKAAYLTLTHDDGIAAIDDASALHDYLLAHHNGCFKRCTIYVTLEPCAHVGRTPSCASLITQLSLKKVVIGTRDPNPEAANGKQRLDNAGIHAEITESTEAAALLFPFITWQQGTFVTYKWAQRLDGTIDGGIISSQASRTYVHAMRNVADLLVIGGNTVRTDRPTLDARLVNGKAPDVLILSRTTTFDPSIPLFQVPDRKVFIRNDLTLLEQYKNVMIEGGPGLLESVIDKVDYFCGFVAPKSGGTIPFTKRSLEWTLLHTRQLDDDILMWLRKA